MTDKYITNPLYAHLEKWVRELPTTFNSTGNLIYDGRNKVRVYDIDNVLYAVKRYKFPIPIQRIIYSFFRKTKARRAYEYAMRLIEMGIGTPTPVAYIETYSHGLFEYGYFVSLYRKDKDCNVLHETHQPQLAQTLAQFVASMHKQGFYHGDSNISNFLFYENTASPTGYTVYTIDINRSRFYTTLSRSLRLKNLMMLTGDPSVSKQIASLYAAIEGWDTTSTIQEVQELRDHFNRHRRHLRFWKNFFRFSRK